jgi:hypothetical protein
MERSEVTKPRFYLSSCEQKTSVIAVGSALIPLENRASKGCADSFDLYRNLYPNSPIDVYLIRPKTGLAV